MKAVKPDNNASVSQAAVVAENPKGKEFFATPGSMTATQELILNAAIFCVKKWGIERVTLNDIAYEAKVARSTVYKYYTNRDDVIREALLQSAYGFGLKLVEHILQFGTPAERLIESVMYGIKTLPDEPSLMLLSDNALSHLVREHTLTTPQGLDMGSALLQVVLSGEERDPQELAEMSETAIRFMLSLVTMASPHPRSDDELRGYVARRLLPAVGFSIPEQYQLIKQK